MDNTAYETVLMRLRTLHFNEIFHGEDADIQTTNELCETEFENGAFCVTIFATGSAMNAEKILQDINQNKSDILLAAQEIYEIVAYCWGTDIIVILNYKRSFFYEMENLLKKVFYALAEQKSLGVIVMAIGVEVDRFEQIARSYDSAKTGAFARLSLSANRIYICGEKKRPAPNDGGILHVDLERKLANDLKNRNIAGVKAATAALLDGVVNQAKKHPLAIFPALDKILGIYKENCQDIHLDGDVEWRCYYQKRKRELEISKSFEDVYDIFCNIIQDITISANVSNHGIRNLGAVLKMRRYIEENYKHDISLTELAAIVGMNKNYICDLFKRGTGVSIHQYLINQRMERVKLLLRDSNYTIAEIANYVGYSDDKYLSTQFKKRYGITPGEYRKKLNDGTFS